MKVFARKRIVFSLLTIIVLLTSCSYKSQLEYQTYNPTTFFAPYSYKLYIGNNVQTDIRYDTQNNISNSNEFASQSTMVEILDDVKSRNPNYIYEVFGNDRIFIKTDDINGFMIKTVTVSVKGTAEKGITGTDEIPTGDGIKYQYSIFPSYARIQSDNESIYFYVPIWLVSDFHGENIFEQGKEYILLDTVDNFKAYYQNSNVFDITDSENGFTLNGYKDAFTPIYKLKYKVDFTFGTNTDGQQTVKINLVK